MLALVALVAPVAVAELAERPLPARSRLRLAAAAAGFALLVPARSSPAGLAGAAVGAAAFAP